jgi:hypothetical protein
MVNSLEHLNFYFKTLHKQNGSWNTTKGLTTKLRSRSGFTGKGPNKELYQFAVSANWVLPMQKVSPSVLFKGYYVLAKHAYTSVFLEQWEALDVETTFQPRFGVAGMKYGLLSLVVCFCSSRISALKSLIVDYHACIWVFLTHQVLQIVLWNWNHVPPPVLPNSPGGAFISRTSFIIKGEEVEGF